MEDDHKYFCLALKDVLAVQSLKAHFPVNEISLINGHYNELEVNSAELVHMRKLLAPQKLQLKVSRAFDEKVTRK